MHGGEGGGSVAAARAEARRGSRQKRRTSKFVVLYTCMICMLWKCYVLENARYVVGGGVCGGVAAG